MVIEELLQAAIAAPSMHNTQPWMMRIKDAGTKIELFADAARILPVADPEGRTAYIACGAALFNLRVAAAASGLLATIRLMPDAGQPLFVAEVELSDRYQASPEGGELRAAVPLRHTDREPYSDVAVPPGIRTELADAARTEKAMLRFLDDNEAVRVRRLAADAERELLENPAYRAELARWVGHDRHGDGIPSEAIGPRSAIGRDPVRDFRTDRREPVRYADFEDKPQLAVLSVRGHDVPNWIAAGQALERVWLTATCRGISLCPLTQALETPDAWLVRDTRWGFEYPQMIMRIGYGAPARATTPRRPIADVASWA
jgi:nitroreductase